MEVRETLIVASALEEKKPFEVCVHHLPLCVTFYFYNNGSTILVDPNVRV